MKGFPVHGKTMAKLGYAALGASIKTPRSLEYELLAQITTDLISAIGSQDKDFPTLVAALHRNRELWLCWAVDVADDTNALPRDLRGQVFYLAQFVQHHTSQILSAKVDPTSLIDINKAILKGLEHKRAIS